MVEGHVWKRYTVQARAGITRWQWRTNALRPFPPHKIGWGSTSPCVSSLRWKFYLPASGHETTRRHDASAVG